MFSSLNTSCSTNRRLISGIFNYVLLHFDWAENFPLCFFVFVFAAVFSRANTKYNEYTVVAYVPTIRCFLRRHFFLFAQSAKPTTLPAFPAKLAAACPANLHALRATASRLCTTTLWLVALFFFVFAPDICDSIYDSMLSILTVVSSDGCACFWKCLCTFLVTLTNGMVFSRFFSIPLLCCERINSAYRFSVVYRTVW